MAITTGIEYCDSTVNSIMGCEGCELCNKNQPEEKRRCYAYGIMNMRQGMKGWPKSFWKPEYFPGRIEKAIMWPDLTGEDRPKKPWLNGYPRIIFVNDLSDSFVSRPDAGTWLYDLLPIMGDSPHIWLLMTKRPWEMHDFFVRYGPIPENVWLGVSITSQYYLNRLNALTRIPARVRFISMEPLIGPMTKRGLENYTAQYHGIDWLIAGGESGNHARPMHPKWPLEARDFAVEKGIPFFFKQWGEWYPSHLTGQYSKHKLCIWSDGSTSDTWDLWDDKDGVVMARIGKKKAGRVLKDHAAHRYARIGDTVIWNQMPQF